MQSIEGPPGIGKTWLFDHVLRTTDLGSRHYLTLKIDGNVDGNDPSAKNLVRSVARLVASAEADAIRDRPTGFYFPAVGRVIKAIDRIRDDAASEFRKRSPDCEEGRAALLRFLDLAVEAGKGVNDAIPITRKYVNVREVEKSKSFWKKWFPPWSACNTKAQTFWSAGPDSLTQRGFCGIRSEIMRARHLQTR